MIRANKILAPTDLSEFSITGLRYALNVALSSDAELVVYNVITNEETAMPMELSDWISTHEDSPRVQDIIRKRRAVVAAFLKETFSALASKIKLRVEVETGLPYKRIIEKAAEEGADLIVMSTHGRTGLLHMLIGSVTEKVVRRASCPVLTIHPRERQVPQKAVA